MRMTFAKRLLLVLVSMMLTTSCGKPNILTEFSQTDSDAALFIEAQKKIDAFAWDEAIAILTVDLSSSFRSRTEVKEALMGAYAGKCGLSFVNLFKGLANMSASDSLFVMVLKPFAGVSVDPAACELSETILKDLGATYASRTNDQNLFATMLGFAKMGTYLHSKFDVDTGGIGDGGVDVGWDSCPASASTLRLEDAEVDGVILGLGMLFENLAALTAAISGANSGVDAISDAMADCEAALGGAPGACTITDPASITPVLRRLFRRMISSSSFGYGTCDINDMIPPVGCCPAESFP